MRGLSTLLERVVKALDRNTYVKQIVLRGIKESTGVELKEEDISIKNGVLEISASAIVKSELKLKQDHWLKELNEGKQIFIQRVLYH